MDTVTTNSNTTIADEAVVVNKISNTRIPDEYPNDFASISDFLSKPFLSGGGEWTTADVANDQLNILTIGSVLATNPYFANKIEGFNLIRADAVIRLQVTCTPFHQGKLLLHLLPCNGSFTTYDLSYEATHNANLATKTQQPGIEVDCSDTAAIITIPYVAPTAYKAVIGHDWGDIFLSVLSPLKTGASAETTVYWSLYIHFENVELAAPLCPQSRSAKKRYSTKKFSRSGKSSTKRISNAESEECAIAAGPVESALLVGKSISDALGSVPFLAPLAEPASWVLGAASSVASFFGWSKPEMNTDILYVSLQKARYAATSDGASSAIPLSLIAGNCLTLTSSKAITDADQMSFDFLKSVPSMIKTVNWPTTTLSGSSLYSIDVGPNLLYSQGTTVYNAHTTTWRTGPPIYYLAECFSLWRGSIDVLIKLSKTEFHSGRLQITWTPNNLTPVSPDITTSNLALREIIDIKSGSELRLNLPYLLDTDYIGTQTGFSGRLDIIVLNTLRCPETCEPSIDLLVYVSGGSDFEFAGPSGRAGSVQLPFSPQSGEVDIVEESVGGGSVVQINTLHAEMCTGEMFSSIKQLFNRSSRINVSAYPVNTEQISVWPYFRSVISMNHATGALASGMAGGDIYSYLAPMYVFYRGGARISRNSSYVIPGQAIMGQIASITTNSNTAGTTKVIDVADDVSNPYTANAMTAVSHCNQGISSNSQNDAFVEYSIPYISRTPVSFNMGQTTSNVIPGDVTQSRAILQTFVPYASTNYFRRSFRDDFQLSYFIGCPPKYISYV